MTINPVDLICSAIATEEGWLKEGTVPKERNNPGDLRFAGQVGASAPGWVGGQAPIATFSTPKLGQVALYR